MKYEVTELSGENLRACSGGFFFLYGIIAYAINTTLVAGTAAAAGGAVAYSFETGKKAACNCK